MDILPLVERIGENPTSALFGLITGILFGVAAQRSRFCLRAATVEFARGQMGPAVTVWLLTFSTALFWVQLSEQMGLMRAEDARMMAVPGTWSGAIIGGLLFGVGMVLARGCSGRLLVLASTGNLRALVSGLVLAVVAQMSLHGWLAPLRDGLAKLWLTAGGHNLNLLDALGLPDWFGVAAGFATALFALAVALKNKMPVARLVFASGVGFSVAVGWVLTYALANVSFEPMVITSATFTGPSANTLMFFLTSDPVLEFDIGLVPGVFLGGFAASVLRGEFEFQGFTNESFMRRSMTGAVLMGFGGMLAGGCAIGNGVTGTSIFTGTSWLALLCMWIGAMLTDRLVDQRGAMAPA
ncbi:YeeE/YedE family protein [Thalassovita taeanensis]|uniref:Sulphur transport n=1 Tax=Thalassovita taeanensis TaxID=657014 RepID=A0A1H9AE54_9RHOB|nr:YeeE/YedE family protein [Thalassovita taeanensis]SEP74959.1 Sulphur transport [Thalassovita taeanensis]